MLEMLTEVNVCVSGAGLSPKDLKLLLGEDYAFWNASRFHLFLCHFVFSFVLETSSII